MFTHFTQFTAQFEKIEILQSMTVTMLVDILFYLHIRIKSQIGIGTEDVLGLGIASQVLGLGLEGQVLGLVTSGLDSKSICTTVLSQIKISYSLE